MSRSRTLRTPLLLLLLGSLVAALAALAPLPARAGQSGACALPPRSAVGQPDPALYQPAVGTLRALMLFVDFPDAVAGPADSPRALEDLLVPGGGALLETMSGGRLDLQVTAERRWLRMPKRQADYTYARGLTFAAHQAYLRDAVAAADPTVDLSPYQVLYVVPVKSASNISFSPAFIARPGDGLQADGVELRAAVSFGQDLYGWGSKVLDHETGHLLGLPDLYDYADGGAGQHRFVGGWDLMGFISGRSPGLLAWYRWTLGWVDDGQVVCAGAGTREVVLTPVETPGGTKVVVLRTGTTSAVVAEFRRAVGEDARACRDGLLVATLDATAASGSGPVRVVDARPGSTCGEDPLDDAPFGGDVPTWTGADGSTLTVVGASADALRVRVTRPGSATPSPGPSVSPSATASPTASPGPAHRVPSLSLSPSGPVPFGTVVRVTISGTPGARVDLLSRLFPARDFTPIRRGLLLDGAGQAVVETRPNHNLRLAASDPQAPGLSAQPLVQVRKALSLAVSCTAGRCSFRGSAKPVHPGQVVEVYRGTRLVRRLGTASTGAWSFTAAQPRGTATFTVRSPATGYNTASTGPLRTVRVP